LAIFGIIILPVALVKAFKPHRGIGENTLAMPISVLVIIFVLPVMFCPSLGHSVINPFLADLISLLACKYWVNYGENRGKNEMTEILSSGGR
jgi:hypothetical protein